MLMKAKSTTFANQRMAPRGTPKQALLRRRLVRSRLARRRQRAGFTLVEMMVAMLAGVLVAAAAFLLARNASSFFQKEARITGTQLANMVGLTRLQNDLRRVSMMSTSNVRRDPSVCGRSSSWPAGLDELAGLRIVNGGSAANHGADHKLSKLNNLNPDSIIVGGMQGSTEHFSVQAIESAGGGGMSIYLQLDGALWRSRARVQSGQPALADVFRAGRFIRLVDEEGRQGFGVITGINEKQAVPVISVASNPSLPTRDTATVCGCTKPCTGALVNSVTRVRYDLRNLANVSRYAALYTAAQHAQIAKHRGVSPVARTELVRVELDAEGNELVNTLELVAEYAVDLKFGATVRTPGAAPNFVPNITRFPIGASGVYTQAASLQAGGRPERVTAVQVRMSTRAPRRDRDVALAAPLGGGLYRFFLGTGRGYARVRTLITDVQLVNQRGSEWM